MNEVYLKINICKMKNTKKEIKTCLTHLQNKKRDHDTEVVTVFFSLFALIVFAVWVYFRFFD